MVWTAALTLLLLSQTAQPAPNEFDRFDDEWETIDPEKWHVVFTMHTGTVVYLRGKDMNKPSGHMFWVRMDHSKDPTFKSSQSMMRYRSDCRGEALITLSTISYGANGASQTSRDYEPFEQRPKAVVPDSAGEVILKNVCPWTTR